MWGRHLAQIMQKLFQARPLVPQRRWLRSTGPAVVGIPAAPVKAKPADAKRADISVHMTIALFLALPAALV
jgi:hypothetical protein